MKEKLQERIKEIETAISNCISQHSILQGHLAEAKNCIDMIDKIVDDVVPDQTDATE